MILLAIPAAAAFWLGLTAAPAAALAEPRAERADWTAPAEPPSWPDSAGAEPMLGDTLDFSPPVWDDSSGAEPRIEDDDAIAWEGDGIRPRTPFGDRILTDPEEWIRRGRGVANLSLPLTYNRVDQLAFSIAYEMQASWTHWPRVGARLGYSPGRRGPLYGLEVEQPLTRHIAIGGSVVRLTDHNELHQVGDFENSLAFLLGRQDYRDYFGRQGYGGHVSARLGGVTTLGVHARNDRYRSLVARLGTQSLFHRSRSLRPNPPIEEGEAHRLLVRLERLAHRPLGAPAGLYHWIEFERAGHGWGGDFRYQRLLADARSVIRLSPAMTLAVRLVAGSHRSGDLPPQREFTAGGVDGLRGHSFQAFRGNQLAMVQGETMLGLWRLRRAGWFEGGLHAIAFLDAGRAWDNPDRHWDPLGQHFAVDGGFGLATAEDNLRVYFAKNLRDSDSDFVISARLRRPF
jgi:hypothetical protein